MAWLPQTAGLAVWLLCCALCPAVAHAENPVFVTDFRGKQIALERPAERIICLIESALSGLYMLGAEEQIIGISTNVYDESIFRYYAAMDPRIRAKELPTPGNWDFVNIESVVALQPDLVVIWSGQEESIRALEEKGIPVFGVYIQKFADIDREIQALGKLTNTEARARELTGFVQQELEGVRQRIAGLVEETAPRVYFMWAQGPLETAGRNSTANELIELAGGRNVAAGSGLEHLVVNLENLLVWNPEVIVMWCNDRLDAADVRQMSSWRSLAAVRTERVHELPDAFSCDFWTLKYLFTVEVVARWCHPDRFESTDLERLRLALFQKLYGNKLPASTLAWPDPTKGVAQ